MFQSVRDFFTGDNNVKRQARLAARPFVTRAYALRNEGKHLASVDEFIQAAYALQKGGWHRTAQEALIQASIALCLIKSRKSSGAEQRLTEAMLRIG